jgi:DNA gyrase subunit A
MAASDTPNGSSIKLEEFGAIMERAFATYGLSVVTDRALPDARDGLKPVQRRILYCMWAARYFSTRPTVKSAEVVGRVLGDFHPHSDTAVYDAAVAARLVSALMEEGNAELRREFLARHAREVEEVDV